MVLRRRFENNRFLKGLYKFLNDFRFISNFKIALQKNRFGSLITKNRNLLRVTRDITGSASGQPSDLTPYIEAADDTGVRINRFDSSFIPDPGLGDAVAVRPVERPISTFSPLFDEISVRLPETPVTQNHTLMDEIFIKPVVGLAPLSLRSMDEISDVRREYGVTGKQSLIDMITVRGVESPVSVISTQIDDISIKVMENRAEENTAFLDYICVKQSPGPVNIEYELMDDLITKSAVFHTGQTKPSYDVVTAENTIQKPQPAESVSINDITDIFREAEEYRAQANKNACPGLNLAESHKNAKIPAAVKNMLAALRIYNNSEFYIRDTALTNVDIPAPKPGIKNLALHIVDSTIELDKLIKNGSCREADIAAIRRGVKKGMLVLLLLADGELVSAGWACTTEESRAALRGYPYKDDLDRSVCIAGEWTSEKFPERGISDYMKSERRRRLFENGFTLERSLVRKWAVKDPVAVKKNGGCDVVYKRRTYTNVSLFGILGLEFWREHRLDETESTPAYQMSILSLLVLPSPPAIVAELEGN
jgi:hypothetical protein